MSIERVKEYLVSKGFLDRVIEPETPTPTVEAAASALGTTRARIAKSLAFDAGGETILIVAAGDSKIDNSKFKSTFGMKAKMLSPEETLSRTGYAVGGVCPFALNEGVKVYTDVSLKRFDTVYPAAGNARSGVKLSPEELYTLSSSEGWVEVTKTADGGM